MGRPLPCDTGEHSTPAAGGRDPRGGGWSAPTEGDLPTVENACTGAVLVPASTLPGGSRPQAGVSFGVGVSGRFACRRFT